MMASADEDYRSAQLHDICNEEQRSRQRNLVPKVGSLLDSNAHTGFYGDDGLTPLMAAAQMGFVEAVDVLLEYGADVNARAKTKSAWTPLVYAAANNRIEVVKRLLNSSANVHATDKVSGFTAEQLADEFDHFELKKVISEHVPAQKLRHSVGLEGKEHRASRPNQNSGGSSGAPNTNTGSSGSGNGKRPQSVALWTTNDVCSWASERKLDVPFFRDNDVDGAFLLEFDESVLVELGMLSRVMRLRVISRLKKLRLSVNANNRTPYRGIDGVGSAMHDSPALPRGTDVDDLSADVGRFEFLSTLGRGSFGTTYLVRDRQTNELFAKKELICVTQSDANLALREAVAMLHTKCDSLVQCYDVYLGQTSRGDTSVNIVMEYCDKCDLAQVVASKETVTQKECDRWLISILKGLMFIHSEGLIHRDLKPGNVLMTGDPPIAKLGDFGLARKTSTEVNDMSVAGTVTYMAPEVFRSRNYNTAVDIWSLGVLMIEVAARTRLKQPLTTDDEVSAALRQIPDTFEQDFIDQLRQMLNFDPSRRPTAAVLHDRVKQRVDERTSVE